MTRYALVIGIQKYGGSGFGDLGKSAGDAEAIAEILEAHGDFVEVIRLPRRWNEEKNRHEIAEVPLTGRELKTAIVEFFEKVGSNEALIYFSGHGDQVSPMGRKKGYLVTSDCTTATVETDGIALEDLNWLILEAGFSNLVMLLDCCHSGSLLEKSQILMALGAFRSGDRNYFSATACRGDEKAYEGAEYGLFTAAVLKALRSPGTDGRVRTSKLNQVIDDELRGSGQEPVVLKSGAEITLVTYAGGGDVESEPIDRLQMALEKLRPDYEILDKAFFEAVAAKVANNQARTQMLKLRSANWSMLFQGNYVARDQQGESLEMALGLSQRTGISLMLIRGELGAGKTALLRWLAYELFGQGKRVFHQKIQERFGWLEQLRGFSEAVNGEHFYVITDDVFRDESILVALQQNEFLFPMTLIGTTRQNEDRHGTLEGTEYKTVCLNLAKPSEAEKERVLALPEVQEHLSGKSAAERQKLMDSPIMLVLMLQLSAGKPFDVLLWDIVKDLPNTDRQPLYQAFGVLCCFFQHGIIVPFEILKLCLPLSNYSERIILMGLEGLIDVATYAGYEGLTSVHELISKTVMTLDFRPDENQNQPYLWIDSPQLLERNLRSVVSNIDVIQETQNRWIYHSLRLLVVNGEANLVAKILHDYSLLIESIQQRNTIIAWSIWSAIYSALGWSDDQQRCIHSTIQTQPNGEWERIYWLSLIQKLGNRDQQQEAIVQTQFWLDAHPDDGEVRTKYLGLVENFGNRDQQQEAIVQTQFWLNAHPDARKVLTKYLGLVENFGDREQKKEAIVQTQFWLNAHPNDGEVRTKYLRLVENFGNREQKKEAIVQTQFWLESHDDDSHVRVKYLNLVEKLGSQDQQQEAIAQTQFWLDTHPDDTYVRIRYLILVENLGSKDEQQEAIVFTQFWLESHPNAGDVRTKYLGFISKTSQNRDNTQILIRHQWSWMSTNQFLEKSLWNAFLPILSHQKISDLYLIAISTARQQHPNDLSISQQIFEYFSDYLDQRTSHGIAIQIYESTRLSVEKHRMWICIANFFRDYSELEKAEDIYYKLIGEAHKKVRQSPELQNIIDLHYAQLFLVTSPPQPDQALDKLSALEHQRNNDEITNHGLIHLLMAKSYQVKGRGYNIKSRSYFEKAIKLDNENNGSFYFEFGCFYRYAVGDLKSARSCFQKSLTQKPNLPASIELVELSAEAGDVELATSYLQDGLSIPLITRPEKEEREKLSDRIIALKTLLNIPG